MKKLINLIFIIFSTLYLHAFDVDSKLIIGAVKHSGCTYDPISYEHCMKDFEKESRDLADDKNGYGIYMAPNEFFPCASRPIYSNIGSDQAILAVGSERGFFAAGMSNAGGLFLYDIAEGVTVFNRINILLLKLSLDREDYLHLRLHASFEEWNERFEELGISFEGYFDEQCLDLKALYVFWNNRVRHQTGFGPEGKFSLFHAKPGSLYLWPQGYVPSDERGYANTFWSGSFQLKGRAMVLSNRFATVNYLYNDDMFYRLKKLADQDKIYALTVSMKDLTSDSDLFRAIEQEGLKLGAIDVSNIISLIPYMRLPMQMSHCEEGTYLDSWDFYRFIDTLTPFIDQRTQVVSTGRSQASSLWYEATNEDFDKERFLKFNELVYKIYNDYQKTKTIDSVEAEEFLELFGVEAFNYLKAYLYNTPTASSTSYCSAGYCSVDDWDYTALPAECFKAEGNHSLIQVEPSNTTHRSDYVYSQCRTQKMWQSSPEMYPDACGPKTEEIFYFQSKTPEGLYVENLEH